VFFPIATHCDKLVGRRKEERNKITNPPKKERKKRGKKCTTFMWNEQANKIRQTQISRRKPIQYPSQFKRSTSIC
jgi:hypothetical protein